VGSALVQYLREACPSVYIGEGWRVPSELHGASLPSLSTTVTSSVGPFSSGDCPTQWYNTALSLQYLVEYADAVMYRENDQSLAQYLKAAANRGKKNPEVRPFARTRGGSSGPICNCSFRRPS
jgi:hypothetical protein